MICQHLTNASEGIIRLVAHEPMCTQVFGNVERVLTIAWNRGGPLPIAIGEQTVELQTHQVVLIDSGVPFEISDSEELVVWQFNRDFYCIVDHDVEVSCAGVLFFSLKDSPILELPRKEQKSLGLLLDVFKEEFEEEEDNLKTEMLRVVLKRLIVILTRLYKKQINVQDMDKVELDVVRQFNVLVEKNFKALHQVQDYADLMNRSPKTISNIFSKFHDQSPREIILDRILLEAKRMLLYTDQNTKEIAFELGFREIPHFSRFFKQRAGMSPSNFRENSQKGAFGKN